MKWITLFFIFSCMLAIMCTENLLFDDEAISGNIIQGDVALEGSLLPNNVFVWLEGLNISTFTDIQGKFKLDLSSAKTSNLTGEYYLYFYVNNYQLDSARVVLSNGIVQPDAGDLDKNHHLKKSIFLFKKLDIEVAVMPEIISSTFNDSLYVTVSLQAYEDTVRVTTQLKEARYLSAVFIRSKAAETLVQLIDTGGNLYPRIPVYQIYTVSNYKRRFTLSFVFDANNFSPGEYEVIPYLLVKPENLPQGLFINLSKNHEILNADFLNIPIARTGGVFQVKAP